MNAEYWIGWILYNHHYPGAPHVAAAIWSCICLFCQLQQVTRKYSHEKNSGRLLTDLLTLTLLTRAIDSNDWFLGATRATGDACRACGPDRIVACCSSTELVYCRWRHRRVVPSFDNPPSSTCTALYLHTFISQRTVHTARRRKIFLFSQTINHFTVSGNSIAFTARQAGVRS